MNLVVYESSTLRNALGLGPNPSYTRKNVFFFIFSKEKSVLSNETQKFYLLVFEILQKYVLQKRLWLWGPPGSFCESYHSIKAMLDLATAAGQPPESLADSTIFQKRHLLTYIPSRKAHLKLGQAEKRHFLITKRKGFDSTTALVLPVIGKTTSL